MMIQALIILFVLTGGSYTNLGLHDPEDDQFTSNLTSDFIPGSFHQGAEREFNPTFPIPIRKSEIKDSSFECSWQAILHKLDLRKDNDNYTVGRPVKDHRRLTQVYIEMRFFAILDVREADEMLVSYIWVYTTWDNEHIWWDPDQFCGQKHIFLPINYLWMPDLTIVEMTERDKTVSNPHLKIHHHGMVEYRDGQVVTSTCKMEVYTFPFDFQTCEISFRSITLSDAELGLSSDWFEMEKLEMPVRSEWMTTGWSIYRRRINHFGFNQTMLVHTIHLKRNSELYVANILLPIFFFLCLDCASFLMSDTGGEKIGFKVTVLLSVTVMQLILVDILPPASDRIPLIEIYCIGAFALMMLSLLETILVKYLIDKDMTLIDRIEKKPKLNEKPDDKPNPLLCCCTGINKKIHCASTEDAAKEDHSFFMEGSSGPHTEVSCVMEKLNEELGEMKKLIDEMPGYWHKTAEKIHKCFTIFYIIAVLLFLSTLFYEWNFFYGHE